MPPLLSFVVPGAPMGKGRPRFSRDKSGGVHTFTPAKTASRENMIGVLAMEQWHRPPYQGAVTMTVTMFLPIPKSWSKKKRADVNIGVRATSKPDVDNCLKLVCDALNQVVWRDDSQVISAHVSKVYAETPCTVIEIWAAT